MRKIFGFIIISFKKNTQYKKGIIFKIISSFIYLVIQIYFWKMIYSNQNNNLSMVYTRMVSYLVISQCISLLVFNCDYLYYIKIDIREGRIINHLVRPYDYMLRYMFESIGKYMVTFLFTLLPMFLMSILFFDLTPPGSVKALCFTIIFTALSFFIYFLMNFILGLTMFWILDMNGLIPIITNCVFQVCSGALFPLVYYPGFIRKIIYILPFRFSADIPVNIYLGNITSMNEILGYLLLLMVWVCILYAIKTILWKKALRKLCIQGG